MYSATRQWNPGDEFILSGSRRIIDTALGTFEPVLYDRNPDVRPSDGTTPAYRTLKRPVDGKAGDIYEKLSAYLRLGFFSNSVKFDSDMSFAALAVLAGSPEWATPRCWSFYDHVFRNRLPLVGLGLGTMPEQLPGFMHEALRSAVLLTTRSKRLAASDLARRYGIDYLPCPALLSAPAARQVSEVRRVAVVLGAPYRDAVWANGLEPGFFEHVCAGLDALIAQHRGTIEFDFVVHYIDEIPVIRDRFPDHAVRYSFDAAEYYGIFEDYDLVVSTRVHGCGIAASLGIPSISLGHDFRSDTTDGFLAAQVELDDDPGVLLPAFDDLAGRAVEVSTGLQTHRQATLDEYVERVRAGFEGGVGDVSYGPEAIVPFADSVHDELPGAQQLDTMIDDLVPVAGQLDETRSALEQVEASKAEMATELDGARAAVVRLEGELAQTRDELAQARNAPTGVRAAVKHWVKERVGR